MRTTEEALKRQIIDVVDQYRSMILDPVEQEMGDSPSWKYVRSRLLKALGDRGLAGRLLEVIHTQFKKIEEVDSVDEN